MQHDNDVILCDKHEEIVPMLFTFKFPHSELWCPYCGYHCGMFNYTKSEPFPDTELLETKKRWEDLSRPYLTDEVDTWELEQTLPDKLPDSPE